MMASLFSCVVLFAVLVAAAEACSVEQTSEKLRGCLSKGNAAFLDCINEKSSCVCLEEDHVFRQCLGECLSLMQSLCPKRTPKTWAPSASEVLKYTAQKPELEKVDGVYVINLKRRPDRLQAFFEKSGFAPSKVQVFEAVDGKALKLTKDIKALFGNCDYKYHRGYISATLSHYLLWKHIAATENQLHLVFEDDAIFAKDFIKKWNANFSLALPHNSQLVYLGGMLAENFWSYKSGSVLEPVNDFFSRHRPTGFFQHDFIEGVDNFTKGAPTPRYFYTSIAYLISSNAARSLVDMVAKFGFRKAADHTLYRILAWTNEAYATTPLLVTVPPRVDSDVQHEANMLEESDSPQDAAANFRLTLLPTRATNRLSIGDVPTYVVTAEAHPARAYHFNLNALAAGLKFAPSVGLDATQLSLPQLRNTGILAPSFSDHALGIAAVALSHITLLEQLLDDPKASHYFILEDSAVVSKDILQRAEAALLKLPANWHILNLGCNPATCDGAHLDGGLVLPDSRCLSGLNAYIVSKEGANAILAAAIPLTAGLDQQLRPAYGTSIRAYCTRPPSATLSPSLLPLYTALETQA